MNRYEINFSALPYLFSTCDLRVEVLSYNIPGSLRRVLTPCESLNSEVARRETMEFFVALNGSTLHCTVFGKGLVG